MPDNNREILPNIEKDTTDKYLYDLKKMAAQNVNSNLSYLTGLPNLRAFFYQAAEIMRSNRDQTFALIVLDIAHFKALNEFCGWDAGDKMLVYIADLLKSYESPQTALFHFRADCFGMLTPFQEKQELIDIAKDLCTRIEAYPITYKVLPSVGICIATDPEMPISALRDYATMALQTIKGKFYAKYAFFDESMRQQMLLEKQIENDIITGMDTDQLQAYVQPKVDMSTGEIIGGEALIRWVHPEKGIISPGVFLPVLEKNGLIIDVDFHIWTQVFAWLNKRIKAGKKAVPISVNISRMHFFDNTFREKLVLLSAEYDVSPTLVALELTESAFLHNTDSIYDNLQQLRSIGFSLSMDDFGTGYSSMTMLKNQPVDEIKIDKGFIDDIDDNQEKIIVSSIITMLKALNKKIIVEGVETQAQRRFLLEQNCLHAQGFLYYKPMPLSEFEALLDSDFTHSLE